MIEINKLKVKYKDKVALDITRQLKIEDGDRVGIIGSNGSGKSTFVKAIIGLVKYDGKIDKMISNYDMAVHMQENNYAETMKIKDIMEAILNTKIKEDENIQEIINYFDFQQCLNKKFKQLSGGQKQRLTIILVLLQDARLTFFDEVTSGLDFETRKSLMEKIKSWYQNKSSSLCIVSHYFEELEQIANKILIIEAGRVVDFDTPDNLFFKYCGQSIIILDKNKKNIELVEGQKQILAPDHLLALSFENSDIEKEYLIKLIDNKISFKRSNSDLEIMYFNAIKGVKCNEK